MPTEPNDHVTPQPPPETADAAYPSLKELANLLPQYEMHEIIGVGGMGAVYKARQIALDRWVAIKVLPVAASQNAEDTQRFIKEARSMAKLVHPHIVAVFDFGQTMERHLFLVMEYIEGMDLHCRTRAGEITPQRAREVIAQLCDALQFAHDRGVAHRDIKPANILITEDWKVKVADFGLARDLTAQPNADEPEYGTPDYTAPERMIVGEIVDHRADIYSLGVVIHEMLTGKTPASAGKETGKGLPNGFMGVISKCLMQEPARRYQKASEVKVALLTATAEKQQQEHAAKKTASIPQQVPETSYELEPPAYFTSYRPSFLSRVGRVLGPIGWGMACLMLVAGFAWLIFKDKLSFEPAEQVTLPAPPAEVANAEPPIKTPEPEPTPEPAKVVQAPQMTTPKVAPEMAEPTVTKPELRPYSVPEGDPGVVGKFQGHTGPSYCLKLYQNESRVISVSMDHSVRIWDLQTQKQLFNINPGIDQILRVQVSADDTVAMVYSTRSDKAALIDLAQGKVLQTVQFPNANLFHAAMTDDGKTVLLGSSNNELSQNLWVWKPAKGSQLEVVRNFTGRVYGMMPAPDGRNILFNGVGTVDTSGKASGNYMMTYEAESGNIRDLESLTFGAISRFFPTGSRHKAFTDGFTLNVVSLPYMRVIKNLPKPPRGETYIQAGVLVDAERLLLTSWSDCTLRVLDVSSGLEVWRTTTAEPVTDIALSGDQKWAMCSTRYINGDQSNGSFDLALWRLPKWSNLTSPAPQTADLASQMADLQKHDPELAKLRENLRASFLPPNARELLEQRQKLDTLYIAALRRAMLGLAPTEQNTLKAEVDLIALGGTLPSEGMDASAPAPLKKLRVIYRQQLSALLQKQNTSLATLAKSVESYLTPLRQKRDALGDSQGAARVASVLKEWQSESVNAATADAPATESTTQTSAGTATKRPERAGTVIAIQRVAQNTISMNPPPEISRIPRTLRAVVAIAGGSQHAFALLPDGSLRAWGIWGGQKAAAPSTAMDVVQVDSTDSAALALRSDGKIIAWGPTTVASPTTWQMKEGKSPVGVCAGGDSSGFVICADGSIQDVGSGEPKPPLSLGPVMKLYYLPMTGGWCAIQRDGAPIYWGNFISPITPLPPDLRDLISIGFSSAYGVALQRDGTMTGWGQLAQDQRFRIRKFTSALELLDDHAGRVFAVHRSDHSWELAFNPSVPEYVAEDRISVVEGRLRGCIDAIFTNEYVIALKP